MPNWIDGLSDHAKKTRKQVSKPELRLPVKGIVISTRNADPKTGDPGECAIGHYAVVDGYVLMCDENGRPTGARERLIGEPAERVAGRLLREAWLKRVTESDFNRPISYHHKGWR